MSEWSLRHHLNDEVTAVLDFADINLNFRWYLMLVWDNEFSLTTFKFRALYPRCSVQHVFHSGFEVFWGSTVHLVVLVTFRKDPAAVLL